MRKIIATTFLSLDGVMQAPGAPDEDPTEGFTQGGWTVNYWDESMRQVMDEAMTDPFDLLLGRKTYEIFAAHWPYIKADPVAKKFNAVTKYVATSSTEPLSWKNSVTLHNVVIDLARLKQEDGPNLLIQGSGNLIQTLLANDLIDQFNLWIFPLVLGSGKRLFGNGTMPAALTLVSTKTSTTGVIMSTYRRAGTIDTGSFALTEPSELEIERRQKMKRELAWVMH
jgi:dihydrofolate reductase